MTIEEVIKYVDEQLEYAKRARDASACDKVKDWFDAQVDKWAIIQEALNLKMFVNYNIDNYGVIALTSKNWKAPITHSAEEPIFRPHWNE